MIDIFFRKLKDFDTISSYHGIKSSLILYFLKIVQSGVKPYRNTTYRNSQIMR